MTLKVNKRWLAVPVSAHAQKKKLYFRNGAEKLVYDLDVRLDPVGAEYTYYVDMKRFLGQMLDIQCSPEAVFDPQLLDGVPVADAGRFRPEAHFTPARGWINDPNGLIFYEGRYHLFFQHNPVDRLWGNMHWGHAVSSDLMHWEEKEIVLFPDESGTMYSGSAIVDERNLTGLQKGDCAPILLFYTAAGGGNELSKGTPYTQCMAYSVDGGETFEKYAGNPIVPHIVGHNRDPKVIFCPEMDAYVMALYLEGRTYALLRSDNLLNWTEVQCIDIPGDDECPDFYPLTLDGEKHWVLSGAHDCYLIGKMESGRFVPVQEVKQLGTARRNAYAAQTYSNLPDNRRVRISWNTFDLPGMPFNGSMTTPVDLFLRRVGGKIALCAKPVPEIAVLHGRRVAGKGCVQFPGKAHDIRLAIPMSMKQTKVSLFGLTICVDAALETVTVGEYRMHANAVTGQIRLRLIQDVHTTELFSEDGAGYLCVGHLADRSLNYIDAPDGVEAEITELKNYRK